MEFDELESLKNRRISLSVSIRLRMLDVIDRIAASEGSTSPRVIERLLRRGLQVERDERAAIAAVKERV